MSSWEKLHRDPRISYYLFLRLEQHCPAREAHARLKQMDVSILVGLHMQRESWTSRLWQWCRSRFRGARLPAATDPSSQLYTGPAKQL